MNMPKRAVSSTSIAMQVYDILKSEIIDGVYPPGYQIVETDVAARLNISRSPVRDAIHQLAREGLLDYFPNRGVYIKVYTAKEVHDIFAVRLLLEQYAISNISPELRKKLLPELQQLMGEIRSATREQSEPLDIRVHELAVRMTGNKVLLNQFSLLHTMTAAFRSISISSDDLFMMAKRSHLALLEAISTGNTERALRVIRQHLESSEEQVQKYYQENSAGGKASRS